MSNDEDVVRTDHSTVLVKIPKHKEVDVDKSEVTCEAENDHKIFYLAEYVNESDVSALPEVEKSMSQAVAKEGSSTHDAIHTARFTRKLSGRNPLKLST